VLILCLLLPVLSCPVLSCLVLSCLVVSCLVVWCGVVDCSPEQIWFSEDDQRSDAARKAKRIAKRLTDGTGGPAAGAGAGAGAGEDDKEEPLDHRQSAERAWERLVSAFKFGDCLVTISTGDAISKVSLLKCSIIHYNVLLLHMIGWNH
jgi:hypothetical protein